MAAVSDEDSSAAPAPELGRREAHKLATRTALQEAADRLFAERGVPATTVRDIADAAGVTERTFFRYFRSKEDLMVDDAFAWLPAFAQVVLARPAKEPPLVALRRALTTVMSALTRLDAASPFALWAEAPPAERVGLSGRTVMLKMEADLADVIAQRLTAAPQPAARGRRRIDPRFRAEVLAREAVAAFRSAMLYDLQLRRDDIADRPSLAQLLDQAFESLETASPNPR
ncbi:TetR family transcriptional regulator [uncultured Jatrophihabitans sp.]|uniref:TetR family transcriptional regulator n=1 Tax=uncultured Jatrophihabitans sp. TaxID=1610747 RepID=UPI0035CC43A6